MQEDLATGGIATFPFPSIHLHSSPISHRVLALFWVSSSFYLNKILTKTLLCYLYGMWRGGGRHSSWSHTTGPRTLGSAVPGTPSTSFTGSLAGLTVPQWRRGTRTAVGDSYLVEQAGVLAGHVPHHQAHLLLLVHVKADQAWQILAWVTPAMPGCVYCCGCTVRLCMPCYALFGQRNWFGDRCTACRGL